MRPILATVLKIVLLATLAVQFGPVTLALIIVMAAPYVIIWNLASR